MKPVNSFSLCVNCHMQPLQLVEGGQYLVEVEVRLIGTFYMPVEDFHTIVCPSKFALTKFHNIFGQP